MTNLEFEILDELYFVSDFEALMKSVSVDESVLKDELEALLQKGWVKLLEKKSDNEISSLDSYNNNYKNYNYLATKEGLLAHNSR